MAEKRCFKCGRTLPLDEFYPHPRMADGHLNKCKSCAKNDAKQRYYTKHDDMMTYDQKRLDDPRRREKQREYGRKKRLVHRAETTASQNRWRERNKHKRHAHAVVNNALRTGRSPASPVRCAETRSRKVTTTTTASLSTWSGSARSTTGKDIEGRSLGSSRKSERLRRGGPPCADSSMKLSGK